MSDLPKLTANNEQPIARSKKTRKGFRFRDFGFDFGFPPFGFYFRGPWRFPKKDEYLKMLEDYKKDLEDELKEVEREIEELKKEG